MFIQYSAVCSQFAYIYSLSSSFVLKVICLSYFALLFVCIIDSVYIICCLSFCMCARGCVPLCAYVWDVWSALTALAHFLYNIIIYFCCAFCGKCDNYFVSWIVSFVIICRPLIAVDVLVYSLFLVCVYYCCLHLIDSVGYCVVLSLICYASYKE